MGGIKTEQEQDKQVKMLKDTFQILTKYNVPAILTNSALLGAYRDGDLIPHCFGAVVTTFRNDIVKYETEITKSIQKKGYKVVKHFKNKNYKIRFVSGRLNIEICAYTEGEKYYYRQLKNKKKVIEKNFLQKPYGNILIRGEQFTTPSDIEGFLNFMYKDFTVKLEGQTSPTKYKTSNHVIPEKKK